MSQPDTGQPVPSEHPDASAPAAWDRPALHGAPLSGAHGAPAPGAAPAAGAEVLAQDFGWHHPGRAEPTLAGVDLHIPAGQKVLVLGPSGSGKSTLLHAMAGLLPEDEEPLGLLTVAGQDPRSLRGGGASCGIGLMQQDPEASVVMSRVLEDVAFGPENRAVEPAQIRVRVAEALAAVGLDLDPQHSTSALSGGQKQRLGLAGILAMHPGLLLLDEPTANLDPAGVREVRDAVVRAAAATGATLVVVEHRVEVWADAVDRVLVLRPGGSISHDGPPAEVLHSAREELQAAGVWVPGWVPRPARQTPPTARGQEAASQGQAAGADLLRTLDLAVTRQPTPRGWARARRRALRRSGGALPSADALATAPWARPGRRVQEHLDVAVRAGEHLAVTGPNGCGKSTLALTLAGLLAPAAGAVSATPALLGPAADRGRPAGSWDPAVWPAAELVGRIGVVFQEPEHQFLRPTVRQELELGPRLLARAQERGTATQEGGAVALESDSMAQQTSPLPDPEEAAQEIMDRLGLAGLAEANPFTLSGGEKRRLSVGTALAARPRVLVLDEPTFGQDALTWSGLVDLLRELLAAGTAVVSVTHDLDYVRALGGRVLQLAASGPPGAPEGAGPPDAPGGSAEQARGGAGWTS